MKNIFYNFNFSRSRFLTMCNMGLSAVSGFIFSFVFIFTMIYGMKFFGKLAICWLCLWNPILFFSFYFVTLLINKYSKKKQKECANQNSPKDCGNVHGKVSQSNQFSKVLFFD